MPGPMFGSMFSRAHQAHIALSEPMTSIVQQGSSLGSCPTSLFLNPYYKRTFVSSSIWWEAVTNNLVDYFCEATSELNRPLYFGGHGLFRRRRICYLSQQYRACVLTTKLSCQMWGLCPYHQLKQKTWNSTKHSCRPNTTYQTNHSCLFLI